MELDSNTLVPVAKLGAVHGLQGAIRLYSLNKDSSGIKKYKSWYSKVDDQWQQCKFSSIKPHSKGAFLAKLEGVDNPETAKKYVNMILSVQRSELPVLEDGEYYFRDLKNLQVINLQKHVFGKVSYVMETGANDVLVIMDEAGEKERLLPYIESVVKEVDLTKKQIIVDWDENF